MTRISPEPIASLWKNGKMLVLEIEHQNGTTTRIPVESKQNARQVAKLHGAKAWNF
jgi:hypothetical protein